MLRLWYIFLMLNLNVDIAVKSRLTQMLIKCALDTLLAVRSPHSHTVRGQGLTFKDPANDDLH